MITYADIPGSRDLLALYPEKQRSAIANLFLHFVRAQYASSLATLPPESAVNAVASELRRRIRTYNPNDKEIEQLAQLQRAPEQALDYARWCIAYAQLSETEREQLREDRSGAQILTRMDHEAPTEKQITYLRKMGYTGELHSKKFANSLIDIYTRGGRVTFDKRD